MSVRFRLLLFFCLFSMATLLQPIEGRGAWSPDVSHFYGPGGMMVYHVESHANPLIMVEILVPGGASHDPDGKEGVASLVAWMFNEGGGEMGSEAFREKLDYYGISLSASAGRDALTVSFSTLSAHLDVGWKMLMDALLKPRFDPTDLERAVADQVASLKKAQENPDSVASKALVRAIYGDHPYGRPSQGTPETLAAIGRNDLMRFHEMAFRLPNLVLAVAGDITLEKLKLLVDDSFSAMNNIPSPLRPTPLAFSKNRPDRQHVELDVPQTAIRLGAVGIHRHDPDYYAMVVMNQILGGGGFTSRLTEEIREKRGLTYGVFSYFSPLSGQGPFVVGMKTKTASVEESLVLLRRELTRIAQEEVDEKELEDVKLYLTGSFPLSLDGLSKLAGIWGVIGFYQRGLDYLEKWPGRIRQVTAGDIRRVAKRILDLDRFHTVTVGRTVEDKGAEPGNADSKP
ncbi:MAG: insulinase family protein [Magnetococcales bacterium]|nr:insulinase family protein [Magnetococcales bacterium]